MNDLIVNINGFDHEVSVDNKDVYSYKGKPYEADIIELNKNAYLLSIDNKVYEVTASKNKSDEYLFTLDGLSYNVKIKTRLDKLAGELFNSNDAKSDEYLIKAPMPGLIVKVNVQQGDEITEGASLLTLEAMKMENVIKAKHGGIIESVKCKEGASVDKNDILINIKTKT